MSKYLKTLAIVASLAAATTAYAAPAPTFQIFNTVEDWNNAVSAMKVSVEDFSDTIHPDFTITTGFTGPGVAGISGGVFNDFDHKRNSSSYRFADGIVALGGNWNLSPEQAGSGLSFYVTINGASVHVGDIASEGTGDATTFGANNSRNFFGFLSTTSFTTMTIKSWNKNDIGEHYTLDNLSYAAPVPEPETYAMLVAGMGLLGGFARRRKQQD